MEQGFFIHPFQDDVWRDNYRNCDEPIEGTFHRVAKEAMQLEKRPRYWANRLKESMLARRISLGGRIVANAGTSYSGTANFNCYGAQRSTGRDVDSIECIYDDLTNAAQILKTEGGVGFNFNHLRPTGTLIKGIGSATPGVIKFMELYDKSSEIITRGFSGDKFQVNGNDTKKRIRKGAMMAMLDIRHPDVEHFITAKSVANYLERFNMSVILTDIFMNAVEADADWELWFPDIHHASYEEEWNGDFDDWEAKGYPKVVYKTVKAKELFELIMQNTYTRNEPGVYFIDAAQRYNNLAIVGQKITGTNPCVTGDTLVATADGRGTVSFKELADSGDDVPVYCLDDKGKVAIKKMRNPRITGANKRVYAVTLDDGSMIRATGNHKFLTRDLKEVEVLDLKPGDSLRIMTKYKATFDEVFSHSNSKSSEYWWINNAGTKNFAEHRLIAEWAYGELDKNVVHHIDCNSLNNSPENLFVMSKKDHDELHRENMLGDANPMRRAKTEWSDNKWQEYRRNLSAAVSGELNGRYSGVSSDELKAKILTETTRRGQEMTWTEYDAFAKIEGLPLSFSNWRKETLGSIPIFLKWAAIEAGVDIPELVGVNNKTIKYFKKYVANGYDTFVGNDGKPWVNKPCEICGSTFSVPGHLREISACVGKCRKELRSRRISKSLKLRNSRILNHDHDMANHKVISVEPCGFEDVYNGTVDDHHNMFIGGFAETTKSGRDKVVFIATKQCGEIGMIGDAGTVRYSGDEWLDLAPMVRAQLMKLNDINEAEKSYVRYDHIGDICNLGNINLVSYASINESGEIEFDWVKFEEDIALLVRTLDNLIDVSRYPLEGIKNSAHLRRKVGIGVMGYGSLLFMMGLRYGSDEANHFTEALLNFKTNAEYKASAELAAEKGPFPMWDDLCLTAGYLMNGYVGDEALALIKEHGLRNAQLSTCAPTGTTGIFMGLVSGGMEPVIQKEYSRWITWSHRMNEVGKKMPDFERGDYSETDDFKIVKMAGEEILESICGDYRIDKSRGLVKRIECEDFGWTWVKDHYTDEEIARMEEAGVFTCSMDLTVEEHADVFSLFSGYVDNSISKTINLRKDYPFEEFEQLFIDMWRKGARGCTTYREGTMVGVLEVRKEEKERKKTVRAQQRDFLKEFAEHEGDVLHKEVSLPEEYPAKGFILKSEGRKWYLHCAFKNKEMTKPFALFCSTNNYEKNVLTFTTLDVLEQLARNVGLPTTVINDTKEKIAGQKNVTKITRMIGMLLRHNVKIVDIVVTLNNIEDAYVGSFVHRIKKFLMQYVQDDNMELPKCPMCGGKVELTEGCFLCTECGGSKC